MNWSQKVMRSLLIAMIWLGTFGSDWVWAEEEDEIPAAPGVKPSITSVQALKTALENYPKITLEEVEEIELVVDDGVLVYEVELKDDTEILIDANSGEFLGIEAK